MMATSSIKAPRAQRLAIYPNLTVHRERLGWTVSEIARRLNDIPSEKSVRRLEDGNGIRASSVFRIFTLVRDETQKVHGDTLLDKHEILISVGKDERTI
jgi:hypothetical protein